LIDKIHADLKTSMKEKDRLRTDTLRLLISRIRNEEIEKKQKLKDAEVAVLVQKEIKGRKEAIELFEKGGRMDLADKERKEMSILESYLPRQLSDEELSDAVDKAVADTGAASPSDLGKVMKEILSKYSGRADGKRVRELVQEKLSSL
jgi:uncharacterized protein YqeY